MNPPRPARLGKLRREPRREALSTLEAVALALTLQDGVLPPTINQTHPDPDCDLDYVPGEGRAEKNIRCIMSNSFAFGGTNAVLIATAA